MKCWGKSIIGLCSTMLTCFDKHRFYPGLDERFSAVRTYHIAVLLQCESLLKGKSDY